MATQPSRNSSCTKRGIILKCYVDGKKRFRALSIDERDAPAAPTLNRDTTRPPNSTSVSLAAGFGSNGFPTC